MSIRALRRSVEAANEPERGTPGGRCPKCHKKPLALVTDLTDVATIAACVVCGWQSDVVQTYLLLFFEMDGEDLTAAAFVRGTSVDHAGERAAWRGLIPERSAVVCAGELDPRTLLMPAELEHRLTPADLNAIQARVMGPAVTD